MGIAAASALLAVLACGSGESEVAPRTIIVPGLTINPLQPTPDPASQATLDADKGNSATPSSSSEVTLGPTLKPTPEPVIVVLTPTPRPTFIFRPTPTTFSTPAPTPTFTPEPTPTPKPTNTPVPTPTLEPGFRLEINGTRVVAGLLEVPVQYGTVRLHQSPREDDKFTEGQTISMEVDPVYPDSFIFWGGIDSANGNRASVFMLVNKLVSVMIVPPPGSVPTPTPTFAGETRLAFHSDRGTGRQIYVMRVDGTAQNRLAISDLDSQEPSWSPNGEQIIFSTGRSGNQEIFVIDADGTNPMNLTRNAATDVWAQWSADGKKIAFTSQRDGNSNIYVMNFDGIEPIRLTDNPAEDLFPTWSPDGKKIAFASRRDGQYEIYSMNSDGNEQTRLTTLPEGSTGDALDHAGSPNGKSIAFRWNKDGNNEIYLVEASGSNLRRLTTDPAADQEPAWSPDGNKIAFSSRRDGNFEIYIMNPSGTQQVNLTNNPPKTPGQPGLPERYPSRTRNSCLRSSRTSGEVCQRHCTVDSTLPGSAKLTSHTTTSSVSLATEKPG